MNTKGLFNRLAATLAGNRDTLGNEKGEAPNNFLADTPAEEKAETFGDTKGDVKAKPNQTLSDNLRKVNAKIKTGTHKAI